MSNKNLAAAFFALLMGLPASACNAVQTVEPAMWVVSDEDTTIYLFGTFHLLPEDVEWFNEDIRRAFDASDELVVETLPPEDGGQATFLRLAGAEDGVPLSRKLDPESAALLAEALQSAGMLPGALEGVDPWFAAVTIALFEYNRLGFSPDNGVEQTLLAVARAQGKSLGHLEGFVEQLHFLEHMPLELQVSMLESTLEDLDEMPRMIGELVENWREGDIAEFAALINDGLDKEPELRELLLTGRNRSWAAWIDERLDQPGAVFVAVGAGHLAGDGSVQQFLAQRGIDSRRLP